MKHRSVAAVIVLTLVTFGIYGIVWQVKTKNEMNRLGANIPTAWLIIVPIANIYWLWKYCEGVEKVTNQKVSGILAFVLFWLVGIVGMAIVQNEFNQVGEGQPQAMQPQGAPAPTQPAEPAVAATTPADTQPTDQQPQA